MAFSLWLLSRRQYWHLNIISSRHLLVHCTAPSIIAVAVQLCFNCELSFVQIAEFHYSEASLKISSNRLSRWIVDTEQKDHYPSTTSAVIPTFVQRAIDPRLEMRHATAN